MENGSMDFQMVNVDDRLARLVCEGRDRNAGKVFVLFADERGTDSDDGAWVSATDVQKV